MIQCLVEAFPLYSFSSFHVCRQKFLHSSLNVPPVFQKKRLEFFLLLQSLGSVFCCMAQF